MKGVEIIDKFLTYAGGILGGYSLVKMPVSDTMLFGLNPVIDLLGALAIVIFAGAFVVRGVKSMLNRV